MVTGVSREPRSLLPMPLAVGVLLTAAWAVGVVWLGAWLLWQLHPTDWRAMPLGFTTGGVWLVGVLLILWNTKGPEE